jgi:anti-anti-sigma regulatory factor
MTDPAVIAPAGELDLHTVRARTPQLDEAVRADYPQVILDMSAVTPVDAALE